MARREPKSYAPVLIKVAVRRLTEDEGDDSLANQIRWAADIAAAAEDFLAERIQYAARTRRMKWREIGTAMNVSGQAAHRKYARRESENDWAAQREREAGQLLDEVQGS